jgi:hypothetical protein
MATTSPILDTRPLPHPAMDFMGLRTQAIAQLQALCGDVWTDYNQHDPGLTILDQLLYAMTDLSYRLDFDIEDLMARPDGKRQEGMFSPRAILPSRALTLDDYRKLIIDVPGVRNAWVETVAFPIPKVFHYPGEHIYRIEEEEGGARITIQGLYRAWVELIPGYDGQPEEVIANVRKCLTMNRNLCEDFMEVRILQAQPVRVVMQIEVGHVEDLNALKDEIFARISAFISPALPQYTLQEMIAKGYRIDEIFEGPALRHGFIDDADLAAYQRRTELRSSDLIQELMNIPGVSVVRDIHLKTSSSKLEKWLLPLDASKAAQLDIEASTVTFYKEDLLGGTYRPSPSSLPGDIRDIPAPWEIDIIETPRKSRDIATYHTVQHHFPANFGLGPNRLLSDASPRRIAQQKQLQGYLLLFEQVLANLFSQAAEAASLYSFTDAAPQTYFSQSLLDRIPGISALLNPEEPVDGLRPIQGNTYCFSPGLIRPEIGSTISIAGPFGRLDDVLVTERNDVVIRLQVPDGSVIPVGPHTWTYSAASLASQLQAITEKGNVGLIRKNKFLNHVMARFGEQLTEYTLLLNHLEPDGNRSATKAISDKLGFLREYPLISADRAGALDYLRAYDTADNLPGFMRRIMRMLGINQTQVTSLADEPLGWLKANFVPAPGITWSEIWAAAGDAEHYISLTPGDVIGLLRAVDSSEVIAQRLPDFPVEDIPATVAQLVARHAEIADRNEGLHIVEHVLLRPRTLDEANGLYVLYREKVVTHAYAHATITGGYVCECPAHGLTDYAEILLRRPNGADLRLKPVELTPDSFVLVLTPNLREDELPKHFVQLDYPEDPYSLQFTVMLPTWPRRNQDENFRKLVEKTIRTEAPAHLKVYLQWLDLDHMHDFEHCHFTWLAHLHHVQ